jgi:hypothetical protein
MLAHLVREVYKERGIRLSLCMPFDQADSPLGKQVSGVGVPVIGCVVHANSVPQQFAAPRTDAAVWAVLLVKVQAVAIVVVGPVLNRVGVQDCRGESQSESREHARTKIKPWHMHASMHLCTHIFTAFVVAPKRVKAPKGRQVRRLVTPKMPPITEAGRMDTN